MNKINNDANKGVRIQMLSRICAVLGLLMLIFLGVSLYALVSDYKALAQDFSLHMNSHDSITNLQGGSDNMTEQSRLFAVTKDPSCMYKYFEIVDNRTREEAHANLVRYFSDNGYVDSIEKLDRALAGSNALMDAEIHSMKLITDAIVLPADLIPDAVNAYVLPAEEERWNKARKLEYARELVFGTEYRRAKEKIDADISEAVEGISDEMENDINASMKKVGHLINRMEGICLLLAGQFIVVFALIQILVIHPIQIYIKCIQENRRFDLAGPRELKYMAATYNKMFDANEVNRQHTDYLLEHDILTNASSRLAFEEQKKVLAQSQIPIALLVFDVDHFKNVNDTYGHEAGDRALIQVVKAVRSLLRSNDIVARIGGDEFAVVLMNVYSYSSTVIGEKLDKINQILQNPEDGTPKLSLSAGVAFSEYGYSEELFQQADRALYEAKSNGRGCYRIYLKED